MGSKYTKRYSEEFKRDAIALVASPGRTVTEVAPELHITSESLRGWVKKASGVGQAAAGAPVAAGSGPDAVEREELKRLRKLATDQARTIEILKKGNRPGRAGRRVEAAVRASGFRAGRRVPDAVDGVAGCVCWRRLI
ncbi:hypothetical protein GCM10010400_12470 [Streptomyces aculeolatus]|uniref:transposase n=1 Tax=Streptomyces aculeolatus TaxID=270689 RepID=UPI001CED1F6D|nr:transposase [Streptomyces aculeolatus]